MTGNNYAWRHLNNIEKYTRTLWKFVNDYSKRFKKIRTT